MANPAFRNRPDFTKPPHWHAEPPPAPAASAPHAEGESPEALSPTRYGDWVRNGIAVDF